MQIYCIKLFLIKLQDKYMPAFPIERGLSAKRSTNNIQGL